MSAAAASLRSQIQAALPRFELPLTLLPQPQTEVLSTGIPEIDRLTQGGVPRGQMTEIAGEASSGRTTLLYSLFANATRKGEYCALIDSHDSFDPASAAQAGMDLSHLLWIRCGGNAEHALQAADRIVQAGGFGLVVFDLAEAASSPRDASRSPPGSACGMPSKKRLPPWSSSRASSMPVPAPKCSLRCAARASPGPARLLRSISFEAEARKHQIARHTAFEARRFGSLGRADESVRLPVCSRQPSAAGGVRPRLLAASGGNSHRTRCFSI